MPVDIVLVRHGQSEGNVAIARSKRGDHSAFTPEFKARHSSEWRLTDTGIEQAQSAGAWLQANFPAPFDKYYVSEYIRTMETAAHLNLPNATWKVKFELRERDLGLLDSLSREERDKLFPDEIIRRSQSSYYWSPPAGESMVTLCLRLKSILNTLAREAAGGTAIIVCHGEIIKAMRIIFERIPNYEFDQVDNPEAEEDHIRNCQILHYTRRNPADPALLTTQYNWKRTLCPWLEPVVPPTWQRISRSVYTNAELNRIVNLHPRQITG